MFEAEEVRKAVIPAAGKGTRVAAVSDGRPKECLDVGGMPMIALALLELAAAEIEEVAVVVSPEKPELVETLRSLPPFPSADWMARLFGWRLDRWPVAWPVVRLFEQREPRGVVHALHQAAAFIGDDPFFLVMPDNLFVGPSPPALLLRQGYRRERSAMIGMVTVTREAAATLGNAGGVTVTPLEEGLYRVDRLHDKTRETFRIPEGQSRAFRAVGRSVVPASLAALPNPMPADGEIDDVPRLQALAKAGRMRGVWLDVEILDLGQPAGLARARRRFDG